MTISWPFPRLPYAAPKTIADVERILSPWAYAVWRDEGHVTGVMHVGGRIVRDRFPLEDFGRVTGGSAEGEAAALWSAAMTTLLENGVEHIEGATLIEEAAA